METKKCAKCGRELPLDSFYKNEKKKDGLYSECKDCARERMKSNYKKRQEKTRKSSLSDFTPRELMEELALRGYKGKLRYVEVHEIDIENF